jgi:hypothetical protein
MEFGRKNKHAIEKKKKKKKKRNETKKLSPGVQKKKIGTTRSFFEEKK